MILSIVLNVLLGLLLGAAVFYLVKFVRIILILEDDFSDAVDSLGEVEKHVETDDRLFRPQEVSILQGDASKTRKVLNWKPEITFKQLVSIMYYEDLKTIAKQNNLDYTKYIK